MRFDLQSSQRRWGIAFTVVIAYVLMFFLLYPRFKEGTAALVVLPVILIAWVGGALIGFLAGGLSLLLNTLLLNLVAVRTDPWRVVFQSGGGPGSVAIVLIGFIVGLLYDQRVQISQQVAQLQQIRSALSEGKAQYRTLFESTQHRAQELALLDRVRQALARELELPLLFRTVVEGIAETFGY